MPTTIFCFFGLFILSACGQMNNHEPIQKEDSLTPPIVQQMFEKDTNMVNTVNGNSRFTFDLYRILQNEKQNENLFFSPFSVSSALAMTYAGARNETQNAMCKTLHFPAGQEDLHSAFSLLLPKLNTNQNGINLNITNSLWAQKDYHFLEDYRKVVMSKYKAHLEYVNFREDAEGARIKINDWVEDKTNDKIKELLQPGILNQDSRLVLVNTIYFLGKWEHEFKKELTKQNSFFTMPTSPVQVEFMNNTLGLKYFENEKMQVVEIPYKDGKMSMIIMLPRDVSGIDELDKTIDYDKYVEMTSSGKNETVVLSIPKFKTTCSFGLESSLSSLGMSIAFDDEADFSGMTGSRQLKIDRVIHKAFIEVSEEGTEAAAATAVAMKETGAHYEPQVNKVFNANHPFLFLIKDADTKSILFLGKIINPKLD